MRYLLLLCLLGGCASWFDSPLAPPPPPPVPPPPPPPPPMLQLVGNFLWPIDVTSPPGDTARIFIAQRNGVIRVRTSSGLLTTPFLDLSSRIPSTDELGMFSMTFHPQYASNGRFYVFYTDVNSNLSIVRFTVSADSNVADAASGDTVLKVMHGGINHHGGQLQFGPDGMLYIGIGDGGCCGDPQGNGQRHHTLLGKILRLNVDGASGYTVPPDNPFVADTSFLPEVWAYGLRNPWRMSFDRLTGDLYIGDVGQNLWEEVDVAAAPGLGKGANYGWVIMEGNHCYEAATCTSTGLVRPVLEYPHTGGACNVQGGYVYRGTRVTQLIGRYLYADYCSGTVSSFTYTGGAATGSRAWATLSPGAGIVSFGQDGRGELYIMTYPGNVYRIVPGT